MRKTIITAAVLVACCTAAAAQAKDADKTRFQVKVLMSDVIADGTVTAKYGPAVAALNGANVKGNDNGVPTLAAEFFLTPKVSFETICCATSHTMNGTGALNGVPLVNKVLIMPFTVTAKYHVDLGPVRPYLGAGPALVLFANKEPSAALKAMGVAGVNIPAKLAFALQAGFDVPLGKGFSVGADLKRYFARPTATFRDGAGNAVLVTHHTLDPVVVSAGVGYRF